MGKTHAEMGQAHAEMGQAHAVMGQAHAQVHMRTHAEAPTHNPGTAKQVAKQTND